jgi:hypothetical protein
MFLLAGCIDLKAGVCVHHTILSNSGLWDVSKLDFAYIAERLKTGRFGTRCGAVWHAVHPLTNTPPPQPWALLVGSMHAEWLGHKLRRAS